MAAPTNSHIEIHFEIRVPSEGYQWLRHRKNPDDTVRIDNAPWPRDPVLAIVKPEE